MPSSRASPHASSHYATAVFLGSTSFIFLNFALPVRADDLGLTAVQIGLAYTVFTGTMLLVRPLVGWLLDAYGRRWFFTCAFLFYMCSMAAFALVDGTSMLYIARGLQGIGASLMWVSARTMIADLESQAGYGAAMGGLTVSSVRGSMVGATLGFTLVGFMPLAEAWVLAFAGYALMAFGALIWSLVRVTETRPTESVDARSEVRSAIDGRLKRAFVIVFLLGFASALIEPIYILLLKARFDPPLHVLAGVFLPAGLVFAVLPRYAGAWSDRWGRARVIAVGVIGAALVAALLPFWPSLLWVAASYLLFAAGWAMASPAIDALIADLSCAGFKGRTMGAKEAAQGVGAALGPLLGGTMFELVSPASAFVLNAVVLIIAAGLTLYWFADRAQSEHEEIR